MTGKTVLISAGPTREPIDPVRYISNHSSGLMGFALAHEAALRGAKVILVSGTVQLKVQHPNIQRIDVETASQMADACLGFYSQADITIMAAAVADFTPETTAKFKIKKGESKELIIRLIPTKDILKEMGIQKKSHQILVGFALETHDEETNALEKLTRKNADFIVMNSLREPNTGFGHLTNKVTIYGKSGTSKSSPLLPKEKIASFIFDSILSDVEEKPKS